MENDFFRNIFFFSVSVLLSSVYNSGRRPTSITSVDVQYKSRDPVAVTPQKGCDKNEEKNAADESDKCLLWDQEY